ncbi:STN domain-containing protein [Sphingomonas sp. KR3-1]|uniref:STN domain-containing protein n=1 Tax=Sphingomonas sp. KR3-1 TaxID=3156611 RepID=UPI0032B3CA02
MRALVQVAILIAVPGAAVLPLPVAAQAMAEQRDFDIPAGPLDVALEQFARSTGVNFVLETRLIAGRRTEGIHGRMSITQALHKLLAASGLDVNWTSRSSAMIVDPAAGGEGEVRLHAVRIEAKPASPAEFWAYAGLVGAEANAALRRRSSAAGAGYRARVSLWLDEHGAVRRLEVGGGRRDLQAEIRAALAGLIVSRAPPVGLPQPLRFEVSLED